MFTRRYLHYILWVPVCYDAGRYS